MTDATVPSDIVVDLGIDVGGTKVAFEVGAEDRSVYETAFRWHERRSVSHDLAQLADAVGELRAHLGVRFRAVGMAMPATVDPAGHVVAWPSRPEWTGLDVGASLRALFPEALIAWADDGDLGALAEARAAGCDDVLYVGVGTGVGGGLVIDGTCCPGLGRGSFELGHVVVEHGGALCACGRRGCLQAVASGPAVLGRAADLRGAEVTFDELRDGVGNDQSWARSAVDQACRALAAAVVSVHELLRPRLTLIGGGFAEAVPGFVASVSEHVTRLARPGCPTSPVRPAALGGLSSLRGALSLARSL